MYGPHDGVPMTEATPLRGHGSRSTTRRLLTEELFAAHRAGEVRAVSVRASDLLGPHVTESLVGERFFGPFLARKKVQLFADPDMPHSVSFVGDVGRRWSQLAHATRPRPRLARADRPGCHHARVRGTRRRGDRHRAALVFHASVGHSGAVAHDRVGGSTDARAVREPVRLLRAVRGGPQRVRGRVWRRSHAAPRGHPPDDCLGTEPHRPNGQDRTGGTCSGAFVNDAGRHNR